MMCDCVDIIGIPALGAMLDAVFSTRRPVRKLALQQIFSNEQHFLRRRPPNGGGIAVVKMKARCAERIASQKSRHPPATVPLPRQPKPLANVPSIRSTPVHDAVALGKCPPTTAGHRAQQRGPRPDT